MQKALKGFEEDLKKDNNLWDQYKKDDNSQKIIFHILEKGITLKTLGNIHKDFETKLENAGIESKEKDSLELRLKKQKDLYKKASKLLFLKNGILESQNKLDHINTILDERVPIILLSMQAVEEERNKTLLSLKDESNNVVNNLGDILIQHIGKTIPSLFAQYGNKFNKHVRTYTKHTTRA